MNWDLLQDHFGETGAVEARRSSSFEMKQGENENINTFKELNITKRKRTEDPEETKDGSSRTNKRVPASLTGHNLGPISATSILYQK